MPRLPESLRQQILDLLQASETPLPGNPQCLQSQLNDIIENPSELSRADQILLGLAWITLGPVAHGLQVLQDDWSQAEPREAGFAGAYLLQQGLFPQALAALEHAADRLPEEAAHAVNLGRCLTLLNRAEDALPHLQRGLGLLDPSERPSDHNLAVRSLAEALQQLGRNGEALALLPADSSDDKLICARAALLASSGQHDQAAVLLAEALQARPEAEPIRLMAAELAEVCGRSGEAIALLRQALDKDPDNLSLLLQLAGCGTRAHVPPAAREAAEKAMALTEALDPPQPLKRGQALVAQAHVLAGDGEATAAEATYRQALELVPGLVPALSGLPLCQER